MEEVPKGLSERQFLFPVLVGFFLLFPGCAGETPQLRQLVQQQAATIESLNAEIIRLNEEIAFASQGQAENNQTWQRNAEASRS